MYFYITKKKLKEKSIYSELVLVVMVIMWEKLGGIDFQKCVILRNV